MDSGYCGVDAAPRKSWRSLYVFWCLWRVGRKPNISDLGEHPHIQWSNTRFWGLTSTAGELRGEEGTTILLPKCLEEKKKGPRRSAASPWLLPNAPEAARQPGGGSEISRVSRSCVNWINANNLKCIGRGRERLAQVVFLGPRHFALCAARSTYPSVASPQKDKPQKPKNVAKKRLHVGEDRAKTSPL